MKPVYLSAAFLTATVIFANSARSSLNIVSNQSASIANRRLSYTGNGPAGDLRIKANDGIYHKKYIEGLAFYLEAYKLDQDIRAFREISSSVWTTSYNPYAAAALELLQAQVKLNPNDENLAEFVRDCEAEFLVMDGFELLKMGEDQKAIQNFIQASKLGSPFFDERIDLITERYNGLLECDSLTIARYQELLTAGFEGDSEAGDGLRKIQAQLAWEEGQSLSNFVGSRLYPRNSKDEARTVGLLLYALELWPENERYSNWDGINIVHYAAYNGKAMAQLKSAARIHSALPPFVRSADALRMFDRGFLYETEAGNWAGAVEQYQKSNATFPNDKSTHGLQRLEYKAKETLKAINGGHDSADSPPSQDKSLDATKTTSHSGGISILPLGILASIAVHRRRR